MSLFYFEDFYSAFQVCFKENEILFYNNSSYDCRIYFSVEKNEMFENKSMFVKSKGNSKNEKHENIFFDRQYIVGDFKNFNYLIPLCSVQLYCLKNRKRKFIEHDTEEWHKIEEENNEINEKFEEYKTQELCDQKYMQYFYDLEITKIDAFEIRKENLNRTKKKTTLKNEKKEERNTDFPDLNPWQNKIKIEEMKENNKFFKINKDMTYEDLKSFVKNLEENKEKLKEFHNIQFNFNFEGEFFNYKSKQNTGK